MSWSAINEVYTMKIERESNFELLRFVAMFLVLVMHANYFSLG
jgi:peptidoglycan/LPS O-acetylase OafA/YrhL